MNSISTNLSCIRDIIAQAATDCGRPPQDIKLIAVSKTHPMEALEAAIACGQRVFGESTVQESLDKISHFAGRGVEWHFIGHLQSNKTKFVPGNFHWLHSLDSVRLAQRLSRAAEENSASLNVLIEVNVTGDPKKHGVAPDELHRLLDELLRENLPRLALRGLMTIGPHGASEAVLRRTFAALYELREQCVQRFALREFAELSMGMSGDYVPAIREGATMVRLGTAIFGERDYAAR